jgi:catechol 2,3-dioxygenase-like lactoylglutathione lyase family enzyme
VALPVRDVGASIDFYERYASMRVVHERSGGERRVAWLSDLRVGFVVVLLEAEKIEGRLAGFAHLGVGCESRDEVDRLCAMARREGRLAAGPTDSGQPVGYWAFVRDPDGHNLELSFGQEVGLAVQAARPPG